MQIERSAFFYCFLGFAVESRTSIWQESTMLCGSGLRFARKAERSIFAETVAISFFETLIDVSGKGRVKSLETLSNPTTEMSCGTWNPRLSRKYIVYTPP